MKKVFEIVSAIANPNETEIKSENGAIFKIVLKLAHFCVLSGSYADRSG
jgi:hypothetical protein